MAPEQDIMKTPFKRKTNIITRKVAGETILVPLVTHVDRDTAIFTLDDTAAYIWDQLSEPATGRQIAGKLEEDYTVSGEQAETDVRSFLEELKKIDAIQNP